VEGNLNDSFTAEDLAAVDRAEREYLQRTRQPASPGRAGRVDADATSAGAPEVMTADEVEVLDRLEREYLASTSKASQP